MVPVYKAAFEQVRKRRPTAAELECEMGVGRLEAFFGTAKYPGGLGPGMHNHGCVQYGKAPCDPDHSFEAWDTHPLDGGGSERYPICFKKYARDEDGAADLIKHVGNDPLRMLDMAGGYVPAFSLGLYGNGYYEGFNAPPSKIAANRQAFNWIMAHARKPPPGTSQSFRDRMARAADPIHAGRVLNHALALDANIRAICKDVGTKRATKMTPSLIGAREGLGAGAGAILGFVATGNPIVAAVAGLAGLAAGRATR